MKPVKCENAHFYDRDLYLKCPHCGASELIEDLTVVLGGEPNTKLPEQPTSYQELPIIPIVNEVQNNQLKPTLNGWIVFSSGLETGRIIRLTQGQHVLGRSMDYGIPIMKDATVSRKPCASLTYDAESQCHYIESSELGGLIYLNDNLLMEKALIHDYDKITLGETELIFISWMR